ncbi:uncharacterized protein SCHCODRAFT_02630569 [Schizophyllum commune H4-8]|uniref:uncharacterized protein n=1 Tax=Schizophyllum commune (strain H4-8 / FGSC 9210) TaxID=578458 RepID=UPI00215F2113|nr:uncharacterized protein SCHCODRAFT_02646161 [Schizophyllum commune H4-8]XP_050199087.1 uncharacterized protein SCHCODRAFT_02630569 [Schizophyllum commune H4-8]KAI5836559.1 hypothetical protein SCHCODRAFT_02646161 [Schizophyllum commune H4-8]KAI5889990.1 hypothetical protein SCHCODRAFT_02630569 [Schizophyllum commune H4-8]
MACFALTRTGIHALSRALRPGSDPAPPANAWWRAPEIDGSHVTALAARLPSCFDA